MSTVSYQHVPSSSSNNNHALIGVLLVADNLIFSASLKTLLNSDPALKVIEATRRTSCRDAAAIIKPDVILLIIERHTDLILIDELLTASSKSRILTLIWSDDKSLKLNTVQSSAKGVVIAEDEPTTLFAAIKSLHSNKRYVTPSLSDLLFPKLYHSRNVHSHVEPGVETLTTRELQVINLVCKGLGNKEVAWQLDISEPTVKHHMRSVFNKLHISNRAELVAYAYSNGIVQPIPSRKGKDAYNDLEYP